MENETQGRELTRAEARALAPAGQSVSIIKQIMEAARDPAIDAGKVETMANLAMRLQDREREAAFQSALAQAIMAMPRITKRNAIKIPAKDGRPERVQGHFAKFEDIDAVVRPILDRHSLTIRFEIGNDGGNVTIRPIISHANGFVERGDAMKVPADTSGSKNAVQAVGSAVSYAKRYALCAALNIITEGEDNDGAAGVIDPPDARQERLREEARQAAEQANYQAWFGAQPPSDRAWLVRIGLHAELGGAPPPEKRQPRAAAPAAPAAPPAERARRTPDQMVEDYGAKLATITDIEALREYQMSPEISGWLAKLRAAHPDLADRAAQIGSARMAALSPSQETGDDREFTYE